jgi:hypothetical protein
VFFVLSVVIATWLAATACSGGGAGAGGDGGTDTDADAGADAGTGYCGELDAICCDAEPYCVDDTIAVGGGSDGCDCYSACTPAMCVDDSYVWADDVACTDISGGDGIGACIAQEDIDPITTGCEDSTQPCTTASGYADGICLTDGTNDYCMRQCVPDNDVCDIIHHCAGLFDGAGLYVGGACVPN